MPANPSLVPASAGKRLGAKLVDAVLPAVLMVMFWQLSTSSAELLILLGAAFAAYWLWLWGWEATQGNTPGNAILGLRTSNLDGLSAGWAAVFLRGLIIAVGLAALAVGAVIVLISNLWDRNDRRQGWHDKIARTYVFDVRAGRNPLETGGIAAAEPARVTQPLDDGTAAPPVPQVPAPIVEVPGSEVPSASAPIAEAPSASAPIAGVPGVPSSESVPAHPDDDFEATRLRSRTGGTGGTGFRIRFDDGRDVALMAEALIGRDPAARMGETIDQLIDFHDQGRSVSKTHLHLRVEGTTLWVTDRNSTNGSAVSSAEGSRRRISAEEQVSATPGATVHFGDRSFTVENL